MKKLSAIFSILVVTTNIAFADNACKPIAMFCMEHGYYKGGNSEGKGLVENCIMPLVSKSTSMPGATFSDDVLTACKAEVMQKMGSN